MDPGGDFRQGGDVDLGEQSSQVFRGSHMGNAGGQDTVQAVRSRESTTAHATSGATTGVYDMEYRRLI